MSDTSPERYKGYVYRKRASGLVREFAYFNDETKDAAAAKLWAENYIDCVERGELHPW